MFVNRLPFLGLILPLGLLGCAEDPLGVEDDTATGGTEVGEGDTGTEVGDGDGDTGDGDGDTGDGDGDTGDGDGDTGDGDGDGDLGVCAPADTDTLCEACVKDSCCAQVEACDANLACTCLVECLGDGGTQQQCNQACGVMGINQPFNQLTICSGTNCGVECN